MLAGCLFYYFYSPFHVICEIIVQKRNPPHVSFSIFFASELNISARSIAGQLMPLPSAKNWPRTSRWGTRLSAKMKIVPGSGDTVLCFKLGDSTNESMVLLRFIALR